MSPELEDLRIPANQVGVKVAGSICTRTSDIARPSLKSAAVLAWIVIVVVIVIVLHNVTSPETGAGRF